MRTILAVCLWASFCTAVAAESPQAVAETGLRTIYDKNAASFSRIAHPELKRRIRASQLLAIYLSSKGISDPRSLSDDDVIREFCEALKVAIPIDERYDYVCEYLSSENRGDYMLLTFRTGPRLKGTLKSELRKESVVLKKHGDQWLFLWSVPMAFSVDPRWDARKEMPNKAAQTTPGLRPSVSD